MYLKILDTSDFIDLYTSGAAVVLLAPKNQLPNEPSTKHILKKLRNITKV